jgi:hypothetical protein
MFGLLNPGKTDLTYRSIYSRCCQHQHLEYGISTLRFHNFESAFLFALACDVGAVSLDGIPRQNCCRLQASRRLRESADREIGRFCSSFSMLAAGMRSADDLRDAPTLRAKIRARIFHSQFAKARDYFSSLEADFGLTLGRIIDTHLLFERSGHSMPLDEYCQPTSAAFSYVFKLMSRLTGLAFLERHLARIGSNIGSAVLANDCAADWKHDRRHGNFNVVRDENGAQVSLDYCSAKLAAAQAICETEFGRDAISASVLSRVCSRIGSQSGANGSVERSGRMRQLRRRTKREKSVVLNATCCVPYGDGAITVDSDECGSAACGCCCCAGCAIACINGNCCH